MAHSFEGFGDDPATDGSQGMSDDTTPPVPSWWRAALGGRCPRCGEGKLFTGLLSMRDRCPVCGLHLRGHEAGDGAVVLVIAVLAIIVVGIASWVEFRFSPPPWVHAVLWPVVTLPLAILMMRTLRAALVLPRLHDHDGKDLTAGRAWHRLLAPGALTVLVFATLVGLGVWQLLRFQAQRSVVALLEAAEAAPTVPLPFNPRPLQKVRVNGRWLADLQSWYGGEERDIRGVAVKGAHALVPLELDTSAVILVDRGWMPISRNTSPPAPATSISITGWLWPSEESGLFSLPDAPMVRRFYTLNTATIAAALTSAGRTPM